MPSTTAGLIEWASTLVGSIGVESSGSKTTHRAGRLAQRHGVDQHERVVAVEQLVGEVHAADAEVGDPHAVGAARRAACAWRPRRRSRRRRGRCCRCRRRARSCRRRAIELDLVGMEVQVAALPLEHARWPGRRRAVTATCWSPSTSLKTPATVAVRPARNRSCASARRDGLRRTRVPLVTSTPPIRITVSVQGSNAASTAAPTTARDGSTSARRRSGAASIGRSERTAPCSRAQISGGMSSQRSTIAAARGSVPRASAFSSSVSVSTRRARISSISVAS